MWPVLAFTAAEDHDTAPGVAAPGPTPGIPTRLLLENFAHQLPAQSTGAGRTSAWPGSPPGSGRC